jgi:transcriptional pleiotropic regulator of transition state genes
MNIETGTCRKIDDLGRIVIPSEMRHWFKIKEGDELAIFVRRDDIIIRKADATCMFCGSTDKVTHFKERGVCDTCRKAISK